MESSRPIAYLVTLRTFGTCPTPRRALAGHRRACCERRVRVSRLGHVRGERENQSRPLGRCDGGRAGGLGAQPQIVANAQAGGGRAATSQDPALVEAREHGIPLGRSALATRRCTTWCTVKTSSQARFDELNLTAP